MTMYRLVAYHNYETERESLRLSTSLTELKSNAVKIDPIKYKNHTLHIEDNGKTVAVFNIKNNAFVEKKNEY